MVKHTLSNLITPFLGWAVRPDLEAGIEKGQAKMLAKKKKERLITKYKTHESDTGSSQVQIAILTEEIKELTKHLKDHKKDFSSRRGLLRKVAERRRLLNYLKREDDKAYAVLVKDLKLKVVVSEEDKSIQQEEEAANLAAAGVEAKPVQEKK